MHAFRCYTFGARIACDSGPTCKTYHGAGYSSNQGLIGVIFSCCTLKILALKIKVNFIPCKKATALNTTKNYCQCFTCWKCNISCQLQGSWSTWVDCCQTYNSDLVGLHYKLQHHHRFTGLAQCSCMQYSCCHQLQLSTCLLWCECQRLSQHPRC